MGFKIDMHMHTRRYSACSHIEAEQIIHQADRAGLDAIVITEHHYQWGEEELQELERQAGPHRVMVWAGFEYTSTQGDILVYGLHSSLATGFPSMLRPEQVVEQVLAMGGFCVAAHPTRAGLSFDERIAQLPLTALEVHSVNMQEHEQRLAASLARSLKLPSVANSDAHNLAHVGAYFTEFERPVRSIKELQPALQHGKFRLGALTGMERVHH